jgi:hypothetical protein
MSHEEIDVYELENFFRTAEVKLADEVFINYINPLTI